MGLYVHPPFALFGLVDLSITTLNVILQKAHDGSTTDHWYYYLATKDYDAAPQKKPDGTGQQSTEAPIDKSFESPFIGQSLEDVGEWLQKKPKSVDLEGRFFGVLDKKAEMGSVAICRIGNREGVENAISCVLMKAEESSLTLAGMESGNWEELIQGRGEYTPEL